ncbi:uncharacterized protein BP5553_08365 [Venustampulla echinocandica]|uniref:Uncharacterized protein n=1 Tax=Venustampulla echinocandica TaxID=2656787 RepID=A0A370TGH0_9HELO|nr:uncharacterized protein BP5553_08365 [Venustampulla echinocandica]RDL33997.1 hypothetical protein BP5553_08365 [Venustampulla echinocandica]
MACIGGNSADKVMTPQMACKLDKRGSANTIVEPSEQSTAVKTIQNRKADSPGADTSDSDDNDNDIGDDAGYDTDEFDPGTNNKQIQRSQIARPSRARTGRPHPNGRFVGRQLVMWHRPRMIEKLLLHVQYECQRAGLPIPWDKVVKRLTPGSSGTAAVQHLNRLRDVIVSEGHMVPPLLGKLGTAQDPRIRGYIRDMDEESPIATRIVDWNETIEDRKENLVVPGVVRGSGNYRRRRQQQTEIKTEPTGDEPFNSESANIKQSGGGRRSRLPKKLQEDRSIANARKANRPPSKAKRATKGKADATTTNVQEVGATELDSDDDYDPKATQKPKAPRRRSTRTPIKVEYQSESEHDQSSSDDEPGNEAKTSNEALGGNERDSPATPAKSYSSDDGLMTPPASALPIVKLCLDPSILARFPAGVSGGTPAKLIETPVQHGSLKHSFSNGSEDELLDVSPSILRSKKVAKLRHGNVGQYSNGRADAPTSGTRAELMRNEQMYTPKPNAKNTADNKPRNPPPKMEPLIRYDQGQVKYGKSFPLMSRSLHARTGSSNSATKPYDLDPMNALIQQNPLTSLNFAARQAPMNGGYGVPNLSNFQSAATSMASHWNGRHSTSASQSHGLPNYSYQMPLYSDDSLVDFPNSIHGNSWPSSASYHPTLLNQGWEDAEGNGNDAHVHSTPTSHRTSSNAVGSTMTKYKNAHPDDMSSRTCSSPSSVQWTPSGQTCLFDVDDMLMQSPPHRSFPTRTPPTTDGGNGISSGKHPSYGSSFF